eukprot:4090962-Pleurochrysis_carterae.AAC.1
MSNWGHPVVTALSDEKNARRCAFYANQYLFIRISGIELQKSASQSEWEVQFNAWVTLSRKRHPCDTITLRGIASS